jgi:ActD protein
MTEHVFGGEFLVATFDGERALLGAVRAVRARGLRVHDVYCPYPVHRLDEALGIGASRLPFLTLAGGVLGLLASLSFQFYVAVFDWPLNVGGKPDNSTLAFVPIAFELTVLGAGLATVAALLLRCGLFPTARVPLLEPAATDDVFALVLRWRHIAFDPQVEHLLHEHGACDVVRKGFAS